MYPSLQAQSNKSTPEPRIPRLKSPPPRRSRTSSLPAPPKSNLHPSPDHADPHAPSPDATEDTLTPSLVFNIFLSVVITGFSVYWALTKFTMPAILARTFTSWTGPGGQDGDTGEVTGGASDAVRVLVSFFAALAVAVAEAFLYGAYLEKVSRARAKEKRVKERKVFVGRVGGRGRR